MSSPSTAGRPARTDLGPADPSPARPEPVGPVSADPEPADPERADPERADPERADPESADRETADRETAGRETAGRETADRPTLPLLYLDTLWLQVTGTLCNIACRHCFVSAGPKVEIHRMMSVEQVRAALDQGASAGMRAAWYTGGEPLLHPRILELVDLALERVPLGILSNGMLIDEALAAALGRRFREAPYALEIRISLDGPDAASNDRVRGKGVFDAACAGIRRLAAHGLEPIVAISALDDLATTDRAAFTELLGSLGVRRPRIKWIPPFRIGREAGRRGGRPYAAWEQLGPDELTHPEAAHRVQCGTSRCVTAEGAWACPILVNEPAFRMGDALVDALRPHPVDHPACSTCWAEAFSCST